MIFFASRQTHRATIKNLVKAATILGQKLDKHIESATISEFWKELQNSGGFAFHVGGDFPGLELELWAIRQ